MLKQFIIGILVKPDHPVGGIYFCIFCDIIDILLFKIWDVKPKYHVEEEKRRKQMFIRQMTLKKYKLSNMSG